MRFVYFKIKCRLSDDDYKLLCSLFPEILFPSFSEMKEAENRYLNTTRISFPSIKYVRHPSQQDKIVGLEMNALKAVYKAFFKLVGSRDIKSIGYITIPIYFDAAKVLREVHTILSMSMNAHPFVCNQSYTSLQKLGLYFVGEDECKVQIKAFLGVLNKITGVHFKFDEDNPNILFKQIKYCFSGDLHAMREYVDHGENCKCFWCGALWQEIKGFESLFYKKVGSASHLSFLTGKTKGVIEAWRLIFFINTLFSFKNFYQFHFNF